MGVTLSCVMAWAEVLELAERGTADDAQAADDADDDDRHEQNPLEREDAARRRREATLDWENKRMVGTAPAKGECSRIGIQARLGSNAGAVPKRCQALKSGRRNSSSDGV